jgi:integrase
VRLRPEAPPPERAFAGACRRARIVGLHWHDLTHTFGARMAEAGYGEATIAELMGRCDTKTTRRYTHATDRAKRAAVESVRLVAGGTCPKYAPKQEQPPKLAAVNG